jgi:GDPmannose 4,6-dehydratase
MKTALITGIRGQDGAYLANTLLEKGYRVIGSDRRKDDDTFWRLKSLGIEKDVEITFMDLLDMPNIFGVLQDFRPDEVYNLAAQSAVGTSFKAPFITSDVNSMGVLRLLDGLRTNLPEAKFYQASSSEMFGKVQETPQSETTSFYPRSPYGVSKLFAHWMTVNYRESYNMFNCSGILFNHESPFRESSFVTRKITKTVAQIKYGQADKLVLGNLDVKRDWGYAKEYAESMYLMLQQDKPDDFVIATGQTHTVRQFVEAAFKAVGISLHWEGSGLDEVGKDITTNKTVVSISKDFYRITEVDAIIGNPAKAAKELNWKAKVKFDDLCALMVESDLKIVKNSK